MVVAVKLIITAMYCWLRSSITTTTSGAQSQRIYQDFAIVEPDGDPMHTYARETHVEFLNPWVYFGDVLLDKKSSY